MRKLIVSMLISFNQLPGVPPTINTSTPKTTVVQHNAPTFPPSEHTISLNIVNEALKIHDIEAQKRDEYLGKWTKKQVTCFVAAAGLCATTVTAVTALIIHFNDCSNS